ncbi:MAG: hypothetical protein ACOZNI_35750 [Myxococcota bacterium]
MILALFAACAPVAIETDLEACTNVDFDDPSPSALVVTASGDTVRVERDYDYVDGTGLTFDPVIATEGKVVHVYEAWSGGDSEDAFCYVPAVVISPVKGKMQVRWYLSPDDATPWDTVEIEGE